MSNETTVCHECGTDTDPENHFNQDELCSDCYEAEYC